MLKVAWKKVLICVDAMLITCELKIHTSAYVYRIGEDLQAATMSDKSAAAAHWLPGTA